MRIVPISILISLLCAGVPSAQPAGIIPKQLNSEIVQAGLRGAVQSITIRTQKKWNVKVQDRAPGYP